VLPIDVAALRKLAAILEGCTPAGGIRTRAARMLGKGRTLYDGLDGDILV
jgi:hypothetical protein